MSEYLRKAAALIEKASETNERANSHYKATLNTNRIEYATAYAMLAAIEKGLLPDQVAEQVYGQFKANH